MNATFVEVDACSMWLRRDSFDLHLPDPAEVGDLTTATSAPPVRVLPNLKSRSTNCGEVRFLLKWSVEEGGSVGAHSRATHDPGLGAKNPLGLY